MDTRANLLYLSTLGYSKLWLDSKILTEEELSEQITEYNKGNDTNTEHYRYRTIDTFLKQHSCFNNDTVKILIELLSADDDKSMAGSAAIELIKKPLLTNEQF